MSRCLSLVGALIAIGAGFVRAGTTHPGAHAEASTAASIVVASDDCIHRYNGTEIVCETAAQVCPNGFCQSHQECHESRMVPACTGVPSMRSLPVMPSSTGLRRKLLPCSAFQPEITVFRCGCTKGILDCCLDDCVRSMGIDGTQICSHGTMVMLVDCNDSTDDEPGDPDRSRP